ncbi:hypothetical protein BDV12DRAFT_163234 [Aspergillus spectabilis]
MRSLQIMCLVGLWSTHAADSCSVRIRSGIFAGRNIKVVLGALRRGRAVEWREPLEGEDLFVDKTWPVRTDSGDPFFSPAVQRLIRQSRGRTLTRFKVIRRRNNVGKTFLDHLPEVLLLVADYLPSPGVLSRKPWDGI